MCGKINQKIQNSQDNVHEKWTEWWIKTQRKKNYKITAKYMWCGYIALKC